MISSLSIQVLVHGLDDWVPLAAIVGLARQLGAAGDADAAEASAASIRELTEHHLVETGSVSDGGFFSHEAPDDSALTRIANAIRTAESSEWGFSCWLRNTQTGDELARTQRLENGSSH